MVESSAAGATVSSQRAGLHVDRAVAARQHLRQKHTQRTGEVNRSAAGTTVPSLHLLKGLLADLDAKPQISSHVPVPECAGTLAQLLHARAVLLEATIAP